MRSYRRRRTEGEAPDLVDQLPILQKCLLRAADLNDMSVAKFLVEWLHADPAYTGCNEHRQMLLEQRDALFREWCHKPYITWQSILQAHENDEHARMMDSGTLTEEECVQSAYFDTQMDLSAENISGKAGREVSLHLDQQLKKPFKRRTTHTPNEQELSALRERICHMANSCFYTYEPGMSAFHIAVIEDNLRLVKYFLESCCQTEQVNLISGETSQGNTSVHLAAYHGNNRTLEVLLKILKGHKESLLKTNPDGFSPLHFAVKNGHFESSILLLNEIGKENLHRWYANRLAYCGSSMWHLASGYGHYELYEFMSSFIDTRQVTYEEISDLRRHDDRTALHQAAFYNQFNMVKLLVYKFNARLESVDAWHNTALLCASSRNHWDVVQLLIAAGANIHQGTEYAICPEALSSVNQRVLSCVTHGMYDRRVNCTLLIKLLTDLCDEEEYAMQESCVTYMQYFPNDVLSEIAYFIYGEPTTRTTDKNANIEDMMDHAVFCRNLAFKIDFNGRFY